MTDVVPTPPNPGPAVVDPIVPPAVPPAPAPVDPAPTDPAPAPIDPPTPSGYWPEDWREKQAGGDEKILKRLQRYASPTAAIDALFNAQQKISSGALKSALKSDATPEEKTAWRADNGIPETPAEYDLTMKNGLIVGAEDKPMVDEFLKRAHESNMSPAQVQEALGFYFESQEQQAGAWKDYDHQTAADCEDALRQEYGPEYRRNLQSVNELLASVPGDVQDKLLSGRLADGTPIGNSPDVIRWLVGLSRELNPIGTVVPGSGTNAVQAVESELSGMRKMMGDPKSEYWRGPNAAKNQARYRDLTTALQKGR